MPNASPQPGCCNSPITGGLCADRVTYGVKCAAGHDPTYHLPPAAPAAAAQPTALVDGVPALEATRNRSESLQTAAPLEHQQLSATNRQVKFLSYLARMDADDPDPRKRGLDLDQPYQRGDVWSETQRRRLIESLLLGVPIPAIILNDRFGARYRDPLGREDWRHAVIDGKQRSLTLIRWHDDELDVPASWFPPEFVERTHDTADGPYVFRSELSTVGRNVTDMDWTIPVAEARLPSLVDEARVYALVNRGGTPMTDEDMAEAFRLVAEG